MKMEKKLSMRSVVGSKADVLAIAMTGRDSDKATTGAAVTIARMIGIATGVKTGEGDNGPWIALIGDHKAINVQTGEEARSSKVFLPSPADELVAAQLAGEGVSSVQYAFDITVQYDESAATSYVYGVEALVEAAENDQVNQLEAALNLPALPSPAKVDAKGKAAAEKESKAKEDAEAKEKAAK